MNDISFHLFEIKDCEVLQSMIFDFYRESNEEITQENIQKTVNRAVTNPEQLQIFFLKYQANTVGYTILSSFWSNEYGGLVLIIDELYIIPEHRNKGIATYFIHEISQTEGYAQLNLEVLSKNTSALKLYKRLGFEQIDRIFMKKRGSKSS